MIVTRLLKALPGPKVSLLMRKISSELKDLETCEIPLSSATSWRALGRLWRAHSSDMLRHRRGLCDASAFRGPGSGRQRGEPPDPFKSCLGILLTNPQLTQIYGAKVTRLEVSIVARLATCVLDAGKLVEYLDQVNAREVMIQNN